MKRRIRRKIKRFLYLLISIILIVAVVIFIKSKFENIINLRFSNLQNKSSGNIAKPNSENIRTSDIEKALNEKRIEYDNIKDEQDQGKIAVSLKSGTLVIFSKFKDVNWQISSLHDIISRLTIENRIPKKIDYSFNKTIVNF